MLGVSKKGRQLGKSVLLRSRSCALDFRAEGSKSLGLQVSLGRDVLCVTMQIGSKASSACKLMWEVPLLISSHGMLHGCPSLQHRQPKPHKKTHDVKNLNP